MIFDLKYFSAVPFFEEVVEVSANVVEDSGDDDSEEEDSLIQEEEEDRQPRPYFQPIDGERGMGINLTRFAMAS